MHFSSKCFKLSSRCSASRCVPKFPSSFVGSVAIKFDQDPMRHYNWANNHDIPSSNGFSSRSLKTREKYTNWENLVCLSLYIFWAQGFSVYFYKILSFVEANIDDMKWYTLTYWHMAWFGSIDCIFLSLFTKCSYVPST